MEPVVAALVLVAVNLLLYAVVALVYRIRAARPLARMDARELEVLGCLWQLPRERGESARRYRRRLGQAVRRYPSDH